MRLRNIPGADEAIANSLYCISNPMECKGHWRSVFPKDNPLQIEVGMGKGKFLMEMAASHPQNNYLGIEKYSSVLLRAIQKMDETPLENLRFLCFQAEEIAEIFDEGEVDRIYLNFSDPWPKDRHARRRLTSAPYLDRYDRILKKDGYLEFKTDNRDLFDFSLSEIEASPVWHVDAMTRDLHHDAVLVQGNVMTEYEERFSSKGNPICKLICSRT
jgi:tRNA (guanine-N7-)-methyltransferase